MTCTATSPSHHHNEDPPQNATAEFDHESISYKFGSQDDYELCSRIGRGKYSTVFSGRTKTGQLCVLKVLKPVRPSKINREIKILQALVQSPNVSHLLDVVRDEESGTITLVIEYAHNIDFRILYQQLSTNDIALYIYKALQALSFAHSRSIMHRDIKPQNIMIDHTNHSLRLIDWGLADFYEEGTAYQVRVATRHYKGPELLLGFQYYDTSLDIWGLGCTFASMLFRRAPFFRGKDNDDLLVKIADTLGSEPLEEYIRSRSFVMQPALMQRLTGHKKKPWEHFVKEDNKGVVTPLALNLLEQMLQVDPAKRVTAAAAMNHPFFDEVREKPQ